MVWLWYRLFQDKGYAGNVILHSEKPSDIPHDIYFYLLNLSVRPEAWKEERYTLLCSMHFVPQEEEMQQAFSNIPNQSEKLSLLLCRSHIERTYAISVAEKWLSIGGKASSIAKAIREKFPVLAEYIDPHPLDQEKVDSYFNSYRKAKLQSTVSVDFQETRMALSLEEFNSRYSYLSNYNDHDTKEDIPKDEFIKYCLEPAKEMRQIIRYQLGIIDPKEYNTPKKRCVPNVQYNDEG